MTMKSVKGYEHTNAWWKCNEGKLSRAPPKGAELVAFRSEGPEKWGMNLLIKVLKYSSYELLKRSGKEWNALDSLVQTRQRVTAENSTEGIDQEKADKYFLDVVGAFGDLNILDKHAISVVDELKKSMYYIITCCFMPQ